MFHDKDEVSLYQDEVHQILLSDLRATDSQVWLTAARLGIPDILKDGPLTAAEIASKAGRNQPHIPTF